MSDYGLYKTRTKAYLSFTTILVISIVLAFELAPVEFIKPHLSLLLIFVYLQTAFSFILTILILKAGFLKESGFWSDENNPPISVLKQLIFYIKKLVLIGFDYGLLMHSDRQKALEYNSIFIAIYGLPISAPLIYLILNSFILADTQKLELTLFLEVFFLWVLSIIFSLNAHKYLHRNWGGDKHHSPLLNFIIIPLATIVSPLLLFIIFMNSWGLFENPKLEFFSKLLEPDFTTGFWFVFYWMFGILIFKSLILWSYSSIFQPDIFEETLDRQWEKYGER